MHSAQLDLNEKLAAQQAAERKLADDQAAAETAKARLATFRKTPSTRLPPPATWVVTPMV